LKPKTQALGGKKVGKNWIKTLSVRGRATKHAVSGRKKG